MGDNPVSRRRLSVQPPVFKEMEAAKSDRSFYAKRFKALAIYERALHSVVMSLFYDAMAGLAALKSDKKAEARFAALSFYHDQRAGQALESFSFRNRIVNFGLNRSQTVKEKHVNELEEYQLVQEIYGEQIEKLRSVASHPRIPIDPKKLIRLDRSGICFGISLDYINSYLSASEKGSDALESLKQISELFKAGGTKQAEMTQILHHAQDMEVMDRLEKKITETREEIARMRADHARVKSEEKQTLMELNTLAKEVTEIFDRVAKDRQEIRQKTQIQESDTKKLQTIDEEVRVVRETINQKKEEASKRVQILMEQGKALKKLEKNSSQYAVLAEGIATKRYQYLANNHDIDLERVFKFDEKDQNSSERFEDAIGVLPNGAYLIMLEKHAITYIKVSDEQGFIMDPNFGTIEVNNKKHAAKYWKAISKGKKQPYTKATFYACTRQSGV